ncbi:outer membrane channel protein TolC [Thalassotalea sp. LPB0316]|uniref:outer membrane channel protein TolC n=1 Tax=Thalassotalea sp. LPB0316 TaxID=2769490 RepID=UPI0018675D8E|nr:outer membrane channel protein TolC [Thalassotalea sp. LPB0316]QOL26813.1 outer membrane channel protein TolC [Thalassotalea sp. LPB0316]
MKSKLLSVMVGLASVGVGFSAQSSDILENYKLALVNDPVILKAQAEFDASKEGITQARSVLLPQINAFAAATRLQDDRVIGPNFDIISTDINNTTWGANLSMQLYHHDSWLKLDNAKKSAHLSDLSYQSAKQDLIVRVANAYFGVLSAQDDLEFANAELKAIERQLEQTKQRFSVGLTAITDVHEAQAQYDNAVTAVIQAENQLASASESLREITNVYPRDLDVLDTMRFSASAPAPTSADEWQQVAETKNLEILGQKVSVDISKENINIARSGHYPTLDLKASYQQSDNTIKNNTLDPQLDSSSIGVQLNVPIYAGGAISSSVRQAQSLYVASSQGLQSTQRAVVRNTRNAYNTVIATVSAIKALEQSVISAESALKATEAGFEVGTRTIVDVLQSTRNLYNAKRNLSSTRYAYINSILALKRAAGTITEADITAIQAGLKSAS